MSARRPRRAASSALLAPLLAVSLALCAACGGDAEPAAETPLAPVDPHAGAEVVVPADGPHPALFAPHLARERAPEKFKVVLETTDGEIEIECVREWSPRGVDRFYNLVRIGLLNDSPFHAVHPGNFAQFGSSSDPKVLREWRGATILDEPALQSNRRGYVSYVRPAGRENSRMTELLINLKDNPEFDQYSAPIGRVVRGLQVADGLCADHSSAIDPERLRTQGRIYLQFGGFPGLDWVRAARIVE